MTKKPKELKDMQPVCSGCRHWKEQTEPGDPERFGTCHRYPPQMHYSEDDGAFPMWSVTGADDRCGEYASVN